MNAAETANQEDATLGVLVAPFTPGQGPSCPKELFTTQRIDEGGSEELHTRGSAISHLLIQVHNRYPTLRPHDPGTSGRLEVEHRF